MDGRVKPGHDDNVSSSRKRGPSIPEQLVLEPKRRCLLGRPVKPGDNGHYFFFTTFGFGSGFSACGSKPI
jgi:hypothetical protein